MIQIKLRKGRLADIYINGEKSEKFKVKIYKFNSRPRYCIVYGKSELCGFKKVADIAEFIFDTVGGACDVCNNLFIPSEFIDFATDKKYKVCLNCGDIKKEL